MNDFKMSHVSPRGTGRLCVYDTAVQRSALAAGTAVGVGGRTGATAGNVSDARLADHLRLVGRADTRSEIWRYFADILDSQDYGGVSPPRVKSVSCFVIIIKT